MYKVVIMSNQRDKDHTSPYPQDAAKDPREKPNDNTHEQTIPFNDKAPLG